MDSNWTHIYGKIALVCFAASLTLGCGKKMDKKDEASGTIATASAPDTSDDPAPGGLEMPKGDVESPTPKESKGGGMEMPEQSSSATPIKIQYATLEEVQKFASTTGKITVLDVWSTSCAPCRKEFPGLVKLNQEQSEKVQCVSLDVDYYGGKSKPPETYEKAVVEFLTSVNAQFPNYLCKTPSEEVYAGLEIASIPSVLIYDANGKLIKKFVDAGDSAGFTYEKDVVPFVNGIISP